MPARDQRRQSARTAAGTVRRGTPVRSVDGTVALDRRCSAPVTVGTFDTASICSCGEFDVRPDSCDRLRPCLFGVWNTGARAAVVLAAGGPAGIRLSQGSRPWPGAAA